jgi:hypothetical protein
VARENGCTSLAALHNVSISRSGPKREQLSPYTSYVLNINSENIPAKVSIVVMQITSCAIVNLKYKQFAHKKLYIVQFNITQSGAWDGVVVKALR